MYQLTQIIIATFTGDPDLIEEKFVRFSYRFKFVDNEYSLSAPFSQICFIPKQEGIFGGGPNESKQDMIQTAYTSTICTNGLKIEYNNIGLKIPLPQGGGTPNMRLRTNFFRGMIIK